MPLTNLLRNLRDRLIYPSYLREIKNIPLGQTPLESSKADRVKVLSMDDLDEPYLPIPTWIGQKIQSENSH